jgi:hypothetical protein
LLIIQRQVISSTVIDFVKETIQSQRGFRVARLQRDGNIGDGMAYGKQIHRSLGAVLCPSDDSPVIAPGILILQLEGALSPPLKTCLG